MGYALCGMDSFHLLLSSPFFAGEMVVGNRLSLLLLLLNAVGAIGIESLQRVRCINYRRRCVCVSDFFFQGIE